MYELIRKGIKLKYRRSYFGIIWSLFEPLLTTAVLVIVFGNILGHREPSFSLYIICGKLLYGFFSESTRTSSRSIMANAGMIKKVYVPKYFYPLSECLWHYVVFLISLVVLIPVTIYARVSLTHRIWHIIPALIYLLILSIGMGLLLSTFNVFLRDIEYLWNVVLLLIMYMSAIFYFPDKLLESNFGFLLKYNPLYCIIALFRSGMLGTPANMFLFVYPGVVSIIILILGIVIFKKNQDRFVLYL